MCVCHLSRNELTPIVGIRTIAQTWVAQPLDKHRPPPATAHQLPLARQPADVRAGAVPAAEGPRSQNDVQVRMQMSVQGHAEARSSQRHCCGQLRHRRRQPAAGSARGRLGCMAGRGRGVPAPWARLWQRTRGGRRQAAQAAGNSGDRRAHACAATQLPPPPQSAVSACRHGCTGQPITPLAWRLVRLLTRGERIRGRGCRRLPSGTTRPRARCPQTPRA